MPTAALRRASVALVILASPAALRAQHRFELTPYVGGYFPTTKLGIIRLRILGQTTSIEAESETAPGFGARLGLWANKRVAVEGSYLYAASKLRASAGILTTSFSANVQAGSLVAMYRATGGTGGTDIILKGGVVAVNHGGSAFQLASNQLDLGGTVGAGIRIDLSPSTSVRVDGETFLYSWSPGPGFKGRMQADVLLSAGIALRLGRS